ncbi:30S ribosomal protein S16, putative [Babesia caballi]|uniref:30S ribosomal protein S16, putative n=1 Tax=Babesia caballi TaxID=5871 RepID=A0AAV4LS49_BABCB|nr:30S ribosomal protein S16, putative [Babesia caballi]
MVRRMFLPYYSKARGPPRLRFQVMGIRGRRFLKLVVANQRDPRDGKHMEVLGSLQRRPLNPIPSAIDETHDSLCEIRLRFSRVKFWLGVGCEMGIPVQNALAHANLIPPPPPKFGLRTKGHYHLLSQIAERRAQMHVDQVKAFLNLDEPLFVDESARPEPPEPEECPARTVAEALYPSEMREHMRTPVESDPIEVGYAPPGSGVIRRIVR